MSDLAMKRGDSLILDGVATQPGISGPVAVDLTGATLWMTAKYKLADLDINAVFQVKTPTDITITDPTNGKFTIIVPAGATVAMKYPANTVIISLFYDIQVKTQAGIVQTIAAGTLFVNEDVTEAIA
jgi:hypothetical protein